MNIYEEKLRQLTILSQLVKNDDEKEELIKERNNLLKLLDVK